MNYFYILVTSDVSSSGYMTVSGNMPYISETGDLIIGSSVSTSPPSVVIAGGKWKACYPVANSTSMPEFKCDPIAVG